VFDHFPEYAEHLKPRLDAAFAEHLARLLGDTKPLRPSEEANLLKGGKKIRGTLLCLVTAALGGTLDAALPRAIAVELIQAATLIHDDFVDQHRVRRNLPAIWTLEGARRAVLLGDIIFSSAIQMMGELGREDGVIVSRAIAEISRGAYQEPLNPGALVEEMEGGGLDPALYEKIIYLKTGVLFGTACQLGAVAANADEKSRCALHRYGVKVGEAYQLADDLHDVEHALRSRCVTANELAALAPPLLFFDGECRPFLLAALRQGSLELTGEPREHFRAVADRMRTEKEKRLRAAVAGVGEDVPDNGLCRLVHRAPWDLVRMFDSEASPASWP